MSIALIGNPNSGKTTLFNELTGANQHVGNWPGVTVEKKTGQIRAAYGSGEIVDLPGIYSLSPFSLEEVVSREYLIGEQPEVVLNIVDATNLERNLYLTIQLIEMKVPVVVALNMMDEIEKAHYRIDVERLSHDLGVPIVPISASKRSGIKELISTVKDATSPKRHELPNAHLERIIALVEGLLRDHLEHEHHLGDAEADTYPLHWAAIKVLENDELVLGHLTLDDKTISEIDKLKAVFESEYGALRSNFASARYKLIHKIIYHGLTVWSTDGEHHHHVIHAPEGYHLRADHEDHDEHESQYSPPHYGGEPDILPDINDETPEDWEAEQSGMSTAGSGMVPGGQLPESAFSSYKLSDQIDRVLTNRVLAIPIFLAVVFVIFELTFSENLFFGLFSSIFGVEAVPSPGVLIQGLVESGIEAFSNLISPLFVRGGWAESLVIGGVIGGVGSVLSFVPQILLLFLFLSLLEDCGYMARAAFVMDRFLRRFGLSGKSFLPMLMGFGCTVPAAMAARTMENENDRRLTLMLVPFMSCGARAPIFLVIAGAFFPVYTSLVVYGLYLLGISVAIVSGIMLRRLLFKGEFAPFIIELPRYRLPQLRTTLLGLWEKLRGYLVRAGTIIFAMSVVLWALSNFGIADGTFAMVDVDESFLAAFGNLIAPVFTPLGFGTWMAAVAILSGFIAKEAVIGTLGTLANVGEQAALEDGGLSAGVLSTVLGFTPVAALSFMVFCLLYIPCVAAFATLKKEFGSWKWAIGQAVYMIVVAYVVSFAVFQIGTLIVG